MIRLTEDYYIDMDDHNYILCLDKHKVAKDGRDVRKVLGYFGQIKELLNYWAEVVIKDHLMNDKEVLTLGESVGIISRELEAVRSVIEKAIPDTEIYKTL